MALESILPTLGGSVRGGRIADVWNRAEAALALPAIWRTAAALLVALQLTLVFTHEPWLDEWQALQIALQSSTIGALLENLHYEGHPPLWYLILRFTAEIVPTFWVLPAVQGAIALTLQALVLARAPFGRLERLLLASSFFILFEFGVVARSLSLGSMLLLVLFASRRRWLRWAALALLPMADFLFGVLSLAGLVLMWKDRRWSWLGAGAWALSSLAAAASVVPAPDMLPALWAEEGQALAILFQNLAVLLVPLQMVDGHLQWKGTLPFNLWALAGPLFILFCLGQLRADRLHKLLFLAFFAITAAFCLFVYPLPARHLSLIAFFLILLKWREAEAGLPLDRLFRLWLVTISACGLLVAAVNLVKPFDKAGEAAAFIRSRGLEKEHWVAWPDSYGQGAAALLGRDFYTLKRGCTQSFIRWNFRYEIRNTAVLKQSLDEVADRYGRFYLLTVHDLSPKDWGGFVRPLKRIEPGYEGQAYRLYQIAPDRPRTGKVPPPCVRERRPLSRDRW
jgi:hypothetical protein